MIELYRKMKLGSRAAMFKKLGLGAACFLVLAGIGVGLGLLQRDKTAQLSAETASTPAKSTRDDTLGAELSRTVQTEDEEDADDDKPASEVQGAATAPNSNPTRNNLIQRSEDTQLIAEHQELFTAAISALNDYEQYITNAKYTEAAAFKPKVDAAIAKTTPRSIGSDPRASYSSKIMISVQEISGLLSSAASLYTSASVGLQDGSSPGSEVKLSEGQAKATAAADAYRSLVQQ